MQLNLERQLAETEVLQAIYPDELIVDSDSLQAVQQFVDNPSAVGETELPMLVVDLLNLHFVLAAPA